MNGLIEFAGKHYILFIILSILLIFSLIGYFVNKKRKKGAPLRFGEKKTEEQIVVPETDANMSLSEMLSNNGNNNQN